MGNKDANFAIHPFPVKPDFPSADTQERVKNIIAATHDTAKENRGNAYEQHRVIWHIQSELFLLYDLAAGVYDATAVPGYVFQCGIYCGGSACVMGTALKDNPILPRPMIAIDKYTNPLDALRQDISNAFIETRLNQHKHNLTKFLYIVVGNDLDYVKHFWHAPIRLVFIDSSHSYQHTLSEIRAFIPHVSDGGYMIFHDYFVDKQDGVQAAVNEFFNSFTRRPFRAFSFEKQLFIIQFDVRQQHSQQLSAHVSRLRTLRRFNKRL